MYISSIFTNGITTEYLFAVILFALAVVVACLDSLAALKYLQLSAYRLRGFLGWFKQSKYDYLVRYGALAFFSLAGAFVFLCCFYTYDYVRYLGTAFYIILGTVFMIQTTRSNSKNKIVFTPRAIRLFVTSCILIAAFGFLFAYLVYFNHQCTLTVAALALLSPVCVVLANFILSPFEKLNNKRYEKSAMNKLAALKPKVVGITGSFGKTTAKNMLAACLQKKYKVCVTPGNYNTPMGLVKTVNDNLNSDDEVFIAEMGARFVGDIKELCRIVKPEVGVLTAIGDQHLETFKSRENLKAAKFELFESESCKLGVFGSDTEGCRDLFEKYDGKKVLAPESENVSIGAGGTEFDLKLKGKTYHFKTRLLGRHIPIDAAVAAATALELGVEPEDIVAAINGLEPVAHRLELIEHSAYPIIDDAYNSNPRGARNALEVLREFDGTKIIITPGFVELGAVEESENLAFGEAIAASCDYAFVTGRRAVTVRQGALNAGMPEDRVIVEKTLALCVEALANIEGKKVVLFENDLPDNIA